MKKIASLAAVGLLSVAAAVVPASASSADGPECDHHSHCYGIANYPTGNIDGVGQELWTDCLHLDTPLQDFATHEMWMWTNAPHTSNMNPFIEAGYVRGGIAGGDSQTWFRWFWAEWTGTDFYSHFIANAPVASWNNFSFYKQGNNTWKIYTNGIERGTTVQQASAGTYVQTGGETSEPQVYSHGKSRYLQWHNVGASGWTFGQGAIPTAHAGVYSVTTNGWERMEQISLQKICDPLPGRPPGTLAKSAPTSDEVKSLAVRFASQAGEKNPTSMEMVSTKRAAAQAHVKGGKVDSDQGVYLVQVRGGFTGHMVPRPKGAPAPKGDAITLTIDAATGELTDWSLGKASDLAKLGKIRKL